MTHSEASQKFLQGSGLGAVGSLGGTPTLNPPRPQILRSLATFQFRSRKSTTHSFAHSQFHPSHLAVKKSFRAPNKVNMDAGKVPVKLVKVTRVLGRTGNAPTDRDDLHRIVKLTMPFSRLARWCHTGQSRVHGRHEPKHHPKRQGTRYETQYRKI